MIRKELHYILESKKYIQQSVEIIICVKNKLNFSRIIHKKLVPLAIAGNRTG